MRSNIQLVNKQKKKVRKKINDVRIREMHMFTESCLFKIWIMSIPTRNNVWKTYSWLKKSVSLKQTQQEFYISMSRVTQSRHLLSLSSMFIYFIIISTHCNTMTHYTHGILLNPKITVNNSITIRSGLIIRQCL